MKRFPITLAIAFATITAGSALAIDGQTLVRSSTDAYKADHWVLRRSVYYDRERVVNPLAGPPRTRFGRNRVVYPEPLAGSFGQTGTLRVAGTIMPQKPSALVLRVDGALVDIAEERAIRRSERFEREDIDFRFHSPTEAYDARYPSVVYLDSE